MSGNVDDVLKRLKGHAGDEPPAPGWRRILQSRLTVGGVLALAAAGFFVPVEMTVTAPGQIVPSGRTKAVQHLEGGIVVELLVRDGQMVKEGDPLLRIDLGAAGLNLGEVEARVAGFAAARVRLQAESTGRRLEPKDFPPDIPEEVRQAEMTAFLARVLEQDGQVEAARSQVLVQSSRAEEIQARIDGLKVRVELLRGEYQIAQKLAEEKLVPELDAIQRRKEFESSRAELASALQAHQAALAAAREARGKLAEVEGRFRRRAAEEQVANERSLSTASEDQRRARDQRERTEVTAPIAGVVKGLKAPEPGWVVKAGEQLLEIVPADAGIEVEARLKPSDRGLVQEGMPVKIKVTAYDFLRYGALEGKVLRISADADRDPNVPTESFFRTVVQTAGSSLSGRQEVTPGMQADVDIVIGHQPFIWYLLRPVLKVRAEAFREP